MTDTLPTPADIVAFWRAAEPHWFSKDAAFDRRFHDTYLAAHEAAAAGRLDAWASDADGALALLVLLDQFPRNSFRDTPRMYATDPQALAIAKRAIADGLDLAVTPPLNLFFYLPLSHAETLADQQQAVRLNEDRLPAEFARHAREHRDIVERFGRFPHRNAILGRTSTDEEKAFLAAGGFKG